jgi:hypothetical protein
MCILGIRSGVDLGLTVLYAILSAYIPPYQDDFGAANLPFSLSLELLELVPWPETLSARIPQAARTDLSVH